MESLAILASASPRRQEILEKIGIQFEVIPSNVIEDYTNGLLPIKMAEFWALEKARNVAHCYKKRLVIGADTIVIIDNKIMGKPADVSESRKMLKTLSGRHHIVQTGVAIINDFMGEEESFVETTQVSFLELDDELIDQYISEGSSLDKAGAYGIQDASACFVEKIDGCYYNVVGFPLARFVRLLRSRKIRERFSLDNCFVSDREIT